MWIVKQSYARNAIPSGRGKGSGACGRGARRVGQPGEGGLLHPGERGFLREGVTETWCLVVCMCVYERVCECDSM